jgi:hypothetical protein
MIACKHIMVASAAGFKGPQETWRMVWRFTCTAMLKAIGAGAW